jgi:bile acid:Na+ symporter, BASS family
MSVRDGLLFAVVFVSMALAVLLPSIGAVFQPYILHLLMLLLFLSFLRIDFRALLDTTFSSLGRLTALALVKLFVLPAILYRVTLFLSPEFAVPALLLSGISTGVVAPFIGSLVCADITQVLRMVIVTSCLVPFTLPAMVEFLAGAGVSIPFGDMVRLLSYVIFTPMAAVVLLRALRPDWPDKIARYQFGVSLGLFAVVNLGVFSKYSSFFFMRPGEVVACLLAAYLLSVAFYAAGFFMSFGWIFSHRLAACVSMAVINNVLVIVFSSQFFGPLAPTLAAMYMFPFYTMIVPVRMLAHRFFPNESGIEGRS